MGLALLRGAAFQFPLLLVLEFTHRLNHLIALMDIIRIQTFMTFRLLVVTHLPIIILFILMLLAISSSVISACFQHLKGHSVPQ